MLVTLNRLMNPQTSGRVISPATIFGSKTIGWFLAGNAGVGVADNAFRTLDTSAGENNISVYKNQVAGQPNLAQATKANMPQYIANDLNGYDSVYLDTANVFMLSGNTVSGGTTNLIVGIVAKINNRPVSYARIQGVTTDAISDFSGTTGCIAISNSSPASGLAVYQNGTDYGNAVQSSGVWRTIIAHWDGVADTITVRVNGSVVIGPAAWTNALTFNRFLFGCENAGGSGTNNFFYSPECLWASGASQFSASQVSALEDYFRTKYGHY